MKSITIKIPNHLYDRAKQVAREREMSFAEVTRRGLEYITSVYPPLEPAQWSLPLVGEKKGDRLSQQEISKAIDADRDRAS
jgi:hypothetical protein